MKSFLFRINIVAILLIAIFILFSEKQSENSLISISESREIKHKNKSQKNQKTISESKTFDSFSKEKYIVRIPSEEQSFFQPFGHECIVFNNRMWIIGGNYENDIWSSADGINWKLVKGKNGLYPDLRLTHHNTVKWRDK